MAFDAYYCWPCVKLYLNPPRKCSNFERGVKMHLNLETFYFTSIVDVMISVGSCISLCFTKNKQMNKYIKSVTCKLLCLLWCEHSWEASEAFTVMVNCQLLCPIKTEINYVSTMTILGYENLYFSSDLVIWCLIMEINMW